MVHSKGMLVVFEGPDGVGKTSLANAVAEELTKRGIESSLFSSPGCDSGSLGDLIYKIHHGTSSGFLSSPPAASLQTLHVAAHIDSIQRQIVPALEDGRIVLLDRFWWSTVAYGQMQGLNTEFLDALMHLESCVWGDVKPSLIFLIERETPLKEELNYDSWTRLKRLYDQLFLKHSSDNSIVRVRNDKVFATALNTILSNISSKNQVMVPPVKSGALGYQVKEIAESEVPELFHGGEYKNLNKLLLPGNEMNTLPSKKIHPAKPTVVYDTLWRFAVERQEIFFRRLEGQAAPWTDNAVLRRHKFTNAYRASDRVSQYLIRNVIYSGDQEPEEVLFRILVFKLFNKIDTWELLEGKLGVVSYSGFDYRQYDQILSKAKESGSTIYSGAYIMPSGRSTFGHSLKHRNHLELIQFMMADRLVDKLANASTMSQVFTILKSYPTIGSFLAFQLATDINYSPITDFDESQFVVLGPGAHSGMSKCFSSLGGLSEEDVVFRMTAMQEEEFERLGLRFQNLWGRRLQPIDIQNLLCEVDKYARIAHPEIPGIGGRVRIKQVFRPVTSPIEHWYPPKWGVTSTIK